MITNISNGNLSIKKEKKNKSMANHRDHAFELTKQTHAPQTKRFQLYLTKISALRFHQTMYPRKTHYAKSGQAIEVHFFLLDSKLIIQFDQIY